MNVLVVDDWGSRHRRVRDVFTEAGRVVSFTNRTCPDDVTDEDILLADVVFLDHDMWSLPVKCRKAGFRERSLQTVPKESKNLLDRTGQKSRPESNYRAKPDMCKADEFTGGCPNPIEGPGENFLDEHCGCPTGQDLARRMIALTVRPVCVIHSQNPVGGEKLSVMLHDTGFPTTWAAITAWVTPAVHILEFLGIPNEPEAPVVL